jgi:hypothetical protein
MFMGKSYPTYRERFSAVMKETMKFFPLKLWLCCVHICFFFRISGVFSVKILQELHPALRLAPDFFVFNVGDFASRGIYVE